MFIKILGVEKYGFRRIIFCIKQNNNKLRSVNSIEFVILCGTSFFEIGGLQRMEEEKKKCGLYMRVSTEDQARERIQFARAKRKTRGFLQI